MANQTFHLLAVEIGNANRTNEAFCNAHFHRFPSIQVINIFKDHIPLVILWYEAHILLKYSLNYVDDCRGFFQESKYLKGSGPVNKVKIQVVELKIL